MSEKKFCYECGYSMDIDEQICPECGKDMRALVEECADTAPSSSNGVSDGSVMGAGTRANIMGSVNTNTNTVNTNTSHRTTNANIQTSNVDNSSVVNNTTIVMEGKKTPEFCEVCGSPFDEKHARCPKCGKMICFDCQVKGKNRCVECEKKAVNEYRLAFQQLLLTTNGNLGTAGRQMMNQKARELNVEDVKAVIEKELMEEYKPAVRAEQPVVVPNGSKVSSEPTEEKVGSKGGVVDNRTPLRPKNNGGGGSMWIVLILVLLLGAGAYFMFSGRDASEGKKAAVTEQPEVTSVPAVPQEKPAQTVQQSSAATTVAPAAKPAQIAKPAEPKKDVDYEAGMAAYNRGEGLEAIKKFNASGSAQANFMLGTIYEKGCGNVAANAMMARKYYKKAAQQGSEEAKAKL